MSEWTRNERLEQAYEEMYRIRVEAYSAIPFLRNVNRVRLLHNGREAVITETLDYGLTKVVCLECAGDKKEFSRVIDAEREANAYLRSKNHG